MWLRSSSLVIALAACSGTESVESTAEEELSRAGGVTVIQCNPFFAGRYDRYPNKGATTYATAHRKKIATIALRARR